MLLRVDLKTIVQQMSWSELNEAEALIIEHKNELIKLSQSDEVKILKGETRFNFINRNKPKHPGTTVDFWMRVYNDLNK